MQIVLKTVFTHQTWQNILSFSVTQFIEFLVASQMKGFILLKKVNHPFTIALVFTSLWFYLHFLRGIIKVCLLF